MESQRLAIASQAEGHGFKSVSPARPIVVPAGALRRPVGVWVGPRWQILPLRVSRPSSSRWHFNDSRDPRNARPHPGSPDTGGTQVRSLPRPRKRPCAREPSNPFEVVGHILGLESRQAVRDVALGEVGVRGFDALRRDPRVVRQLTSPGPSSAENAWATQILQACRRSAAARAP